MLEAIESASQHLRQLREALNMQLLGIVDEAMGEAEKASMTVAVPSVVSAHATTALMTYHEAAGYAVAHTASLIQESLKVVDDFEVCKDALDKFADYLKRQVEDDLIQLVDYTRRVSLMAAVLRQRGYAKHTSIINARRNVKLINFKTRDKKGRRYDSANSVYLATRKCLIDIHSSLIALTAEKRRKRFVYMGDEKVRVNALLTGEISVSPRTNLLLRIQK